MSLGATSPRLLERDHEQRKLREAIADARGGRGSLLIVSGESGIGKTSLLRWAASEAGTAGLTVHRARGSQLEQAFAFGQAVTLFGRAVAEDGHALLTGPAGLARPLFDEVDSGLPADPFARCYGLYWLAVALADSAPRLLILDEAQWADDPTLQFLHYLAQRADELSVCIVVSYLPGDAPMLSEVARALRDDARATNLRPLPLSQAAVGQLLKEAGVRSSARLGRVAHAATAGNPFLLVELIREHAPAELESAADRPGEMETLVPGAVELSVRARLDRLGSDARRAAEAIAVLATGARMAAVADLADLDEQRAMTAVGLLAQRAFVDGADPLGFTHPLVRRAVLRGTPEPALRAAHRRAAQIVAGWRPVEVVAAHLLAGEKDGNPWVVAQLRAAAARISSAGNHARAAALLTRALDEPPPEAVRFDVLAELAQAEAMAGIEGAGEHFAAAMELAANVLQLARIRLAYGRALIGAADWAGAATQVRHGLLELESPGADGAGDDARATTQLKAQLEAVFVSASWVSRTYVDETTARLARIVAEESISPEHREMVSWATFMQANACVISAPDALALVDRLVDGTPIEGLVRDGQTVQLIAGTLICTDALEREMDLLTGAIETARTMGEMGRYGIYSYCRTWPELVLGRLDDVIADAEAAFAVAAEGFEVFFPASRAVYALANLERGDLDRAEWAVDIDRDRWRGRIDTELLIPISRARIEMARGRPTDAIESLAAAREAATSAGITSSSLAEWRTWMVEAMLAAGRRDEARSLGRDALEIARRWGAVWPLANVLRAAALAEGGRTGIEMLREAADMLERSPARLVRARTFLHLGASLRRGGQLSEARDWLRRALDEADRCSATAMLQRARHELLAAGARPRRTAVSGVESLTPAELRVARAVVRGGTNREVAQSLFVTQKAVEYHLGNAYRKLEIASREELRAHLGRTMTEELAPAASAS